MSNKIEPTPLTVIERLLAFRVSTPIGVALSTIWAIFTGVVTVTVIVSDPHLFSEYLAKGSVVAAPMYAAIGLPVPLALWWLGRPQDKGDGKGQSSSR